MWFHYIISHPSRKLKFTAKLPDRFDCLPVVRIFWFFQNNAPKVSRCDMKNVIFAKSASKILPFARKWRIFH